MDLMLVKLTHCDSNEDTAKKNLTSPVCIKRVLHISTAGGVVTNVWCKNVARYSMMMEGLFALYVHFEEKILQSLERNGVSHRPKTSSGLWLGTLTGLSAILTILREGTSYSETCLVVGVTGLGLIISCLCLYFPLSMERIAVKDFQLIYFLPAIITSMSYLLIANKGLLVSVAWGLCVSTLGTWGVLQLMSAFPGCFTVGEGTAVMHGGILFLMSILTNLPLRYHLPPIHNNDIATVFLQICIAHVILICLLCKYFPILRVAKWFYLTITSTLIMIIIPLLYVILDQNPVLWVFTFICDRPRRIALIIYWVLCVSVSVMMLCYQVLLNSQASTSTRKNYHLLATAVYIPGMMYDCTLLYLASGVVMGLFMLLEMMRILKLPPLGNMLQEGFSVFVDEKDSLVSLTPLYLLCGLSFPLWMPTDSLPLLILLSGVLTVGIGDTAASYVGSKWGKHKWTNTDKTFEGTIACILTQVVTVSILYCMGYVKSYWLLLRCMLAIVVVSLVEARTNQVDNLALPLLMYVCLCTNARYF